VPSHVTSSGNSLENPFELVTVIWSESLQELVDIVFPGYGARQHYKLRFLAKLERAVYVLHAFQKTTRKPRQADIQLAARRYKAIGDEP